MEHLDRQPGGWKPVSNRNRGIVMFGIGFWELAILAAVGLMILVPVAVAVGVVVWLASKSKSSGETHDAQH